MAALAPTEPGDPLDADSPRSGGWAYPSHKRDAEDRLESADLPHPRVELVLAGVYSKWCELVPLYHQIERVARGSMQPRLYPGPVDRGLTYVHVDAAADAFLRAVETFAGDGGLHRLLVGEDRPVTYRQINRAAGRAFDRRAMPISRVPAPLARTGALLLLWLGLLRGAPPFIRPWMVILPASTSSSTSRRRFANSAGSRGNIWATDSRPSAGAPPSTGTSGWPRIEHASPERWALKHGTLVLIAGTGIAGSGTAHRH
ncbi:MAG: hypothetical protein ABEN55_22330 [Bradymonadaceae bacterium]